MNGSGGAPAPDGQPAGMGGAGRPTAADFRARHRGGGLFTETVNQTLGAQFAVLAHRRSLPPTALTLANLVLGVGASILLVALAPATDGHPIAAALLGLGALLAWQVAYSLDCADGQLARVTGQASPAGARLDILCDIAVQIALLAAIAAVAAAHAATPAWLAAVFAGTWMINLITSVMAREGTNVSLVTSTSLLVRLVKLIRDYGAIITLVGLVAMVLPGWMRWLMALFTLSNGLFLLASIAQSTRAALAGGRAVAVGHPEPRVGHPES